MMFSCSVIVSDKQRTLLVLVQYIFLFLKGVHILMHAFT